MAKIILPILLNFFPSSSFEITGKNPPTDLQWEIASTSFNSISGCRIISKLSKSPKNSLKKWFRLFFAYSTISNRLTWRPIKTKNNSESKIEHFLSRKINVKLTKKMKKNMVIKSRKWKPIKIAELETGWLIVSV